MGYNQKGSNNNAWKGDKAGYSAMHKRRSNETGRYKKGSKCAWCGSTKNLESVTVHGSGGKKFITLCKSCHSKYDKKYKNLKKASSEHSMFKYAVSRLYIVEDKPKNLMPSEVPAFAYMMGGSLLGALAGHYIGDDLLDVDNPYPYVLGGNLLGGALGLWAKNILHSDDRKHRFVEVAL